MRNRETKNCRGSDVAFGYSGLGGPGDVAILSACNRRSLMSFAQISTSIGGAAIMIGATLLQGFFY
ncbi:2-hydroxycarboxylate transporter family protein [Pseudomonas saponiphila]|uniref:2-hydroxycarboxylate transporter family protein n=1 Tax=Pseudomonas saponiphila TaxID=556534 RepID=UPI002AD4680D|nr:2-hydroxycarboxylate transporter family protein [Pseudomonas saponiphila]